MQGNEHLLSMEDLHEDGDMDLQQESSKFEILPATTSRNLSSSSSAFISATQSPFFSPRSPTCQESESIKANVPNSSNNSLPSVGPAIQKPEHVSGHGGKQKMRGRNHRKFSTNQSLAAFSSNRLGKYDVYIGFHGREPSLLRFTNWLRAELQVQGISCFAADRARCRNSRSHDIVERAMNASNFGVVVLTKKSFGNPYSIEELKNFLAKKSLIPLFFDLGPGDCLARDIIEKRGELWEKNGGELWMLYGGLEEEWKEAMNSLSRVDESKFEAQDGNWRDCILKVVILLATRLGRQSAVERVNKWRERVEKEEFPFTRNENFIGRKKELSELELILFGDISGDAENEYLELKKKHKQKFLVINRGEKNRVEERTRDQQTESSSKGKEPVIWKENKKEIEMQRVGNPKGCYQPLQEKSGGKDKKRIRSMKLLYGKGIACVSGDSGIGKTELLLEFAYKFSQRYKMIFWIGGETMYIRQNYLNLRCFLEVDMEIENQILKKGNTKSFEKQEAAAISRIKKELMRDIPFLVVIDNLEKEEDGWDKKTLMDILPRFGGEAHFIISTRLPRIMNLQPLKLSYLSEVEAMSLMKGIKAYPIAEVDTLRVIEEKLGRLTLGLGIVGAILSELPINPTRLLDTVNRMPLRDFTWSSKEGLTLRQQTFFMQLLEVCFSIFDHADGQRSLATTMIQVSGWFGPAAIPISLLGQAAHKIPKKHQGAQLWKRCLQTLTCGFRPSHTRSSEAEASSMLIRFGIARSCTNEDCINFHEIIKLYARKRGVTGVTQSIVRAISSRGFDSGHTQHLWAACFLAFGFGNNPVTVELETTELLVLVKRVVLPLVIHTFFKLSQCNAALELLHQCTDALDAMDNSLVAQVEKWLNKPNCCGSIQPGDKLNPFLWQELAMLQATVSETSAKLMLRGGEYEIAEDFIRRTVSIRTSIRGKHHPDTISAQETLNKIMKFLTNRQVS